MEAGLGEHVAQMYSKQLKVGLVQAAEHTSPPHACIPLIQCLPKVQMSLSAIILPQPSFSRFCVHMNRACAIARHKSSLKLQLWAPQHKDMLKGICTHLAMPSTTHNSFVRDLAMNDSENDNNKVTAIDKAKQRGSTVQFAVCQRTVSAKHCYIVKTACLYNSHVISSHVRDRAAQDIPGAKSSLLVNGWIEQPTGICIRNVETGS